MKNASIRRDFANTDFALAKALIIWNHLIEPGDRVAGELISEMGAVAALDFFLRGESQESDLRSAFERWRPRYGEHVLEEKVQMARRYDLKLILPSDPQWPISLRDLGNHMPLLLWYRGSVDNFSDLDKSISVVGSRNATAYGQKVTSDLVATIVAEDSAVVSGGALGIDSVAHRATLQNSGSTIAVMAGALDSLYPTGNLQLFDEIANRGLLLSEMTPGSRPTRWRFLQRNRLIAALGSATVVTEAGWRSGSINTVGHAQTLNRPVFAIPGPITNPASAGCNRLIREQQANLLLEVADLPAELGWRDSAQKIELGLGSLEVRALDALERKGKSTALLKIESGLSDSELRIALGSLKLLGLVEVGANGAWYRP